VNFKEIKIGDVIEESPGRETEREKRLLSCVVGKNPAPEDRPADAELAVIDLGPVKKMPVVINWGRLQEDFAHGIRAMTTEKPDTPAVKSISELKKTRRDIFSAKVAANTRLIQPILNLGWDAFDERVRGQKIAEVAGGKLYHTTHSQRWIRDLLKEYWRSGCDPLALGPDYSGCGAPSREDRRRAALNAANEAGRVIRCPRRPGRRVSIFVPPPLGGEVVDDECSPGRGGTAIHPSADPIIIRLIDTFLAKEVNRSRIDICMDRYKGLPWESISRFVREELSGFSEFQYLRPTRRQVAYIGRRSVNAMKILQRVLGKRETNLNCRAQRGDYRDVCSFAGQRYEIDVMTDDIHLVDDVSGYTIGRPFVIFVVDRYSGMVAGVYVVTEDIDFAHAGRALHAAYSNKPEWFRQMGLDDITEDDWPCEGIPEEIHADNAQFVTKAAEVIPEFSSDLGITRAYRGDDKPQVEVSFFLQNHGFVHFYGMGVTKGPKQRCKDDPAKKAYVSVRTFTRGLIHHVVHVMNHRALPVERRLDPNFLKTRKLPTPFNVWNWSIGRDGEGGLGGPPRRYDPAIMMPRLFERGVATMTEKGLRLKGIYFDLPEDKEFQIRKALAGTIFAGTRDVPVHFDRLTTRQIYFAPEGVDEKPIACPLAHISRDYADLTIDTVQIRENFHAGSVKGAKIVHEIKAAKEEKRQMAEAKEDLDKLKAKHGTFTQRNIAASSLDKETLKDVQIAAENQAMTDVVHGPAPAPKAPAPKANEPAQAARPSIFE
jgi:hypothetical protein